MSKLARAPASPRSVTDSIPPSASQRQAKKTRRRKGQLRKNIGAGSLRGVSFSTTDYTHGNSITFFDGAQDIKPWERGDRWGRRAKLTADHVAASAGLPILFEPVKIADCYYGDGSTRLNAPLSPAIRLGADKILVITTHRHKNAHSEHRDDAAALAETKPPSLGAIMATIFQSAFSDALDGDLERLSRINHFAKLSPDDKEFKNIPALEIQPSQDLEKLAAQFGRSFSGSLMRIMAVFGMSPGKDQGLLSYLSFDKNYLVP